jgi:hypothetical protein
MEFTPAAGAFAIYRDVLEVPGLIVLANCFTEEAERKLFFTFGPLPMPRQDGRGLDARTGEFSGSPDSFPPTFFTMINLLQDLQVFSNYSTPDYGLSWAYPPGSSFQHHFDSRTQWGETVVGVSLGAPCEMQFKYSVPKARMPAVPLPLRRVWLPRGSLYIMSGRSRFEWTHGVYRVGKAGLSGSAAAVPPHWNPQNWRRSWTFRSTKVYQLCDLKRQQSQHAFGSGDYRKLGERIQAQMEHYPPKKDNYEATCTADEIRAMEATAKLTMASVDRLPHRFSRLLSREARFLSTRALQELYLASDLGEEDQHGGAGGGGGAGGSSSSSSSSAAGVGGRYVGFSTSGFGGSTGEGRAVGGGGVKPSSTVTTSGLFPQGYGLGHLGARELRRLDEGASSSSGSGSSSSSSSSPGSSSIMAAFLGKPAPAAPPVSAEELRRLRLCALEKRCPAAAALAAAAAAAAPPAVGALAQEVEEGDIVLVDEEEEGQGSGAGGGGGRKRDREGYAGGGDGCKKKKDELPVLSCSSDADEVEVLE